VIDVEMKRNDLRQPGLDADLRVPIQMFASMGQCIKRTKDEISYPALVSGCLGEFRSHLLSATPLIHRHCVISFRLRSSRFRIIDIDCSGH
jgi:hypothetical protein